MPSQYPSYSKSPPQQSGWGASSLVLAFVNVGILSLCYFSFMTYGGNRLQWQFHSLIRAVDSPMTFPAVFLIALAGLAMSFVGMSQPSRKRFLAFLSSLIHLATLVLLLMLVIRVTSQ